LEQDFFFLCRRVLKNGDRKAKEPLNSANPSIVRIFHIYMIFYYKKTSVIDDSLKQASDIRRSGSVEQQSGPKVDGAISFDAKTFPNLLDVNAKTDLMINVI
jgi:hypothetical protein